MRKPTGPKHAKCQHHEPSALGLLCFMDDRPTDETIIERLYWADDLAAILAAHQAAWTARAEPDGMMVRQQAYCRHDEPQVGPYTVHANEPAVRFADERVPIVRDGQGCWADVTRYHSTFTGGSA